MTQKSIEINKDKLTEYIVRNCSNLDITMEGTLFCRKKMNATCRVPSFDRGECPRDCPHLNGHVKWACDKEKCSYVKKTIKKLKA